MDSRQKTGTVCVQSTFFLLRLITPAVILVDPSMNTASDTPGKSSILRDPVIYSSRADLWNAFTWKDRDHVEAISHESWAYHDGCSTLAPFVIGNMAEQDPMAKFEENKDLSSLFDEQIFYWTRAATRSLISDASKIASSSTY